MLVVVGYGSAFYFLSLTLRNLPVGVAYAIWSGAGTALVTIAAWIFYGQRLDLGAVLGLSLITAGVIVLQLFSRMAAH
jgi:small multidrug resistance pump